MLITNEITTTIEITTLMDLNKLKIFEEESNLKVNKSALARKLKVDRRTVSKYIEGYQKPTKRKRTSQYDEFYDIITQLLEDENKTFAYKGVLYRYMKKNYGIPGAESSFRYYISSKKEFNDYFKHNKPTAIKKPASMRYETEPGEQAQLDWKESITFKLKSGEIITINIFVLLLSFSRFRIYRLSISKTREVLLHLLNQSFELLGGIPKQIVTDNMTSVMDKARTAYSKGKINNEFQQFANDYGFRVHPCIAGRPQTKSKVESPMRILDEVKAYSGDLTYGELVELVEEINERENTRYHQGYQMIPLLGFTKEKDSLMPLPRETIRNHYSIKTGLVKVNASSMISYLSNQYSVPPEYKEKQLQLQVYDNQIHLYYNTKLVAVHSINNKKLNYLERHYIEIMKQTLRFEDKKIEAIAKENLKKIGEVYQQ